MNHQPAAPPPRPVASIASMQSDGASNGVANVQMRTAISKQVAAAAPVGIAAPAPRMPLPADRMMPPPADRMPPPADRMPPPAAAARPLTVGELLNEARQNVVSSDPPNPVPIVKMRKMWRFQWVVVLMTLV